MYVCPRCGHPVKQGDRFCEQCGLPFLPAPGVPPPPPVAVPCGPDVRDAAGGGGTRGGYWVGLGVALLVCAGGGGAYLYLARTPEASPQPPLGVAPPREETPPRDETTLRTGTTPRPGAPPSRPAEKRAFLTVDTAILTDDAQAMQTILETQPETKARKDATGRDVLQAACLRGSPAVVGRLLEMGFRADAPDEDGHTPLHLAALRGKVEAARVLLQKGAPVNAVSKSGNTPLHLAALYGRDAVVALLIEQHADLNAPNGTGDAPLHLAVAGGHAAIVELLLQHGADAGLRGRKGTPAELALERGDMEVLEHLQQK